MKKGICCAGNMIVDITYPIETWPKQNELTHITEGITRSTGGSVCNTISDLARLDPALPLVASGFAGHDAEGDFVLQEMSKYKNIDCSMIKRSGDTSFTAVMSNNRTKERTFFQYAGGNAYYGEDDIDWDKLDEAGVDPYSDVLTLEQFRKKFGAAVHPFTGVDYIDFYSGIITDAGAEVEVIFGNRVQTLCDYTDAVITCDIHTRARSKRLLKAAGARVVLGLDDLLNKSVDGSGYNAEYGLLGSNKATEETVKLFPRDCMAVAEELGERLSKASGKHIEAMVYGDGAFKDPVGKIWELADPVVSPGYTKGLVGTPNELKLKYLADNDFGDLKGEALKAAIEERIREKTSESLVGNMVSEGTTPRRLTDLIGSLCDLTSGSGDKGTPIVYIQGYFDNYSND